MRGLLVIAAVVVAAQAFGRWNEGLSVRFGAGLDPGRSFFIPLPQTVSEAKNARWVETRRPAGQPLPGLILYTPSIDDVVIGTLYDNEDNVAGLQIALPQDSFEDAPLDCATQGFTQWTAPANSTGQERTYWVTAQYYVSEATLALSAEERAARRRGRVLQEDHIYVTGFHGQLLPIATSAAVADTPTTHFTRQSCIPFMGRHYYYNTTATSECSASTLLPWFAMVDPGQDQLIASGFVTLGRLPVEALVRNYFERPPLFTLRTILPDSPDCLHDLVEAHGRLTMHIYFVDSPLLISCIGM